MCVCVCVCIYIYIYIVNNEIICTIMNVNYFDPGTKILNPVGIENLMARIESSNKSSVTLEEWKKIQENVCSNFIKNFWKRLQQVMKMTVHAIDNEYCENVSMFSVFHTVRIILPFHSFVFLLIFSKVYQSFTKLCFFILNNIKKMSGSQRISNSRKWVQIFNIYGCTKNFFVGLYI